MELCEKTSNQYTFKLLYENTICEFIPFQNVKFDDLPNIVEGKVFYVAAGEYNPHGWFKNVCVFKKDLII
tara:strand:+ start:3011 stop:3220 length:210 start_codon:yes stop_codon:yes gene_type:complete